MVLELLPDANEPQHQSATESSETRQDQIKLGS
jgi:hypothetical protein